MCGIAAIIHADSSSETAAADLHEALYMLQHRGQDACGITTCAPGGRIYHCKGNGMAAKVFNDGKMIEHLPGFMGIAHLRYPTAGTSAQSEAQPFYVNSPYGICFAHNGNLTNAPELRRFLDQVAHRHINTDSDSEILLNIFAHELNETGKSRINAEDCFAALKRMYARVDGGFACVAFIAGFGLIAFRDSYGIRPMVIGSRSINGHETDYMIASESVALKHLGASPRDIKDISPGVAVIIEKGKEPRHERVAEEKSYAPDAFELVYFARPDSVIDGIPVARSRRMMGLKLAQTIERQLGAAKLAAIDVVMAIPETSATAAKMVAIGLDKPFVDGFTKNRYVFRTFIMPNQRLRKTGVKRKLNAHDAEFAGRNVLVSVDFQAQRMQTEAELSKLVDDSIVRGNTSLEIVQMARDAGAQSVVFASCSPPIVHPHIYGIDLAQKRDLIASSKSSQQVATVIGADDVVYQTLPDLVDAILTSPDEGQRKVTRLEVGVFNGQYITPLCGGYLDRLEDLKGKKNMLANGVGKHESNKYMHRDEVVLDGMQGRDIALHNIIDQSP